ncbi:hypothetical protein [Streptomyces sp. NPDC005408]|uniref:hypothetical protein n=1 Tax=Streptomyces sp. NPDC005408 TaxID=3155341 RepID=UPI0033B62FEF
MNAEEIRQQLNNKARAINSKRDLAPRAKQTMLARAYVEARDAIAQLREEEIAAIGHERAKLDRKLFGTNGFSPDPQAVIARRDANDRAARFETPREAEHALRRADREGDHIMAKAIAARAADHSGEPAWSALVHQYVADRPNEAETLKAMQSLPDTNDPVWKLTQAMQYGVVAPEGLGDTSGARVDALAALPLDGDVAA